MARRNRTQDEHATFKERLSTQLQGIVSAIEVSNKDIITKTRRENEETRTTIRKENKETRETLRKFEREFQKTTEFAKAQHSKRLVNAHCGL